MTTDQQDDQYLIPLYAFRGITLDKGKGVFVFDTTGKKYLDMMTGYGPNTLGHAHPAITKAISDQADKLISCHHSFYSQPRAQLAKKIAETCHGMSLPKIFFSNSGTESVEAALKFARVTSNKPGVISTKWAYHGRTFGALAATGTDKYRTPYEPMLPGFTHVPYDDADAIEQAITENIGSVILEPIQGESGVRIPSQNYLHDVRKICNKHNLILILDEVQTGFRTGAWFAYQHTDISPDILCISKGIANGLPMGVTVVTEEIANKVPKGTHGNTFGGSPLVCATALATFDTIEKENLHSHATALGNYFIAELKKLPSAKIREIRGKGLMIAVELKDKCTKYVKALQQEGVLAIPTGTNIIRFLPPLIIEKEHVEIATMNLAKVLDM